LSDNLSAKGGKIEVDDDRLGIRRASIRQIEGNDMGGTGRQNKSPGKDDGATVKKPTAPTADDEVEDGDIATPKRDRSDDDDQPL